MIFLTWAFVREVRSILAQTVTSWSEDQTADCAIALTGGPSRIREGLDLLARKQIQKLIISGVYPQAAFRDFFLLAPFYSEVRDQDVILERRSRSTFGNAQQSLPLVEALRCRDVILITSRIHMYRALRTFRGEFPLTYTIQARSVPSSAGESSWDEVALEAAKSLFYSLWAY
jgi:uncharacterized SAM-binding protein YcdF (DUF218 family)